MLVKFLLLGASQTIARILRSEAWVSFVLLDSHRTVSLEQQLES